jgi:hypothetical protein
MFLGFAGGCFHRSNSADTVLFEAVSPDEKHLVTVFERNAGATVDYSTIIVVRRADEKFDPEIGRIMVASGRHTISIIWTDKTSVVVSSKINKKAIFKQEFTAIDSINVRYQ